MTKVAALMMVGLIALIPLLSGCGIGYTRTLFVTKTNVGFEASTTPPTLELDINRLEGVVAPQFENGKKLPVLASFRFANNGFFSPNIGSAFATGDAANTLAALYSEETPYADWVSRGNAVKGEDAMDDSGNPGDPFPGDSTLVLDSKPQVMPWMPNILEFLKPEFQKKEVRPVFFGTDTSLGIKVAWSGMTGQFPDSAKLGYNRKELALVPISMQQKDSKYRMKMSSLLATVDSGVNGTNIGESGPELDFEHLQYFATGNAATLLALQKDVRKAMLMRLDPNLESYKNQFAQSLDKEIRAIAFSQVTLAHQALGEMENNGVENAALYKNQLNNLGSLVPNTYPFPFYQWESGGEATLNLVEIAEKDSNVPGSGYSKFVTYFTNLEEQIPFLITAKDKAGLKINGKPISGDQKLLVQLKVDLEKMKKQHSDLLVNMNRDSAILNSYVCFANYITKGKCYVTKN